MEAVTTDQTFLISPGLIKPNEDNPRTITDSQFEKLVKSIIEFPEMLMKRPLVIVSNPDSFYRPLGGNMRLQAIPEAIRRLEASSDKISLQKLETLSKGIPCVFADEWNEEQRRQFVIKDNSSFGEWDWDLLSNSFEKEELADWGVQVPDFKFSEKTPEAQEDDFDTTPPVQSKTITGDLYELNEHRLQCGDSTKKYDVTGLMAGKSANLCFTSPPYWVGKDYEYQDNEQQINDFIDQICEGIALAVDQDKGRVVINTGTASINRIDRKRKVEILPLIDKWQDSLRSRGWLLRHLRIWVKRGQLPASISPRTDVIDQHNEYIAAFEKEYSQVMTFWNPDGDQRGQERIGTKWAQQGVWDDISAVERGNAHQKHDAGAAFPVEIPARNLLLYTQKGESVYEPFCGSGTTLIASEQLRRTCFAQEKDPRYCDVTVKRWVAWMRSQGLPFHVKLNGQDITNISWLNEF